MSRSHGWSVHTYSSCTRPAQNSGKCLGEYPEVERKGPVIDVVEVLRNPVIKTVIAAPIHLPQARQPGITLNRRINEAFSNRETSRLGSGRGPTRDISPRSTLKNCGSSSSDVPPQQPTDGSDPRILADFEHRATGFVTGFQLRLPLLSIQHHRAELVHTKPAFTQPVTFLREKSRTGARQPDCGRNCDHERAEESQPNKSLQLCRYSVLPPTGSRRARPLGSSPVQSRGAQISAWRAFSWKTSEGY